jgi:hypothetical protein
MKKMSSPSQPDSPTDSFVMSALRLQPTHQMSANVPSLGVAKSTLLEPYGLDERQLTGA